MLLPVCSRLNAFHNLWIHKPSLHKHVFIYIAEWRVPRRFLVTSSYHFCITSSLLHHFRITSSSLLYYIVTTSSLPHHFLITSSSPPHHFCITSSLLHHFRITSSSLPHHFFITSSLLHHFLITSSSLPHHFLITSSSLLHCFVSASSLLPHDLCLTCLHISSTFPHPDAFGVIFGTWWMQTQTSDEQGQVGVGRLDKFRRR